MADGRNLGKAVDAGSGLSEAGPVVTEKVPPVLRRPDPIQNMFKRAPAKAVTVVRPDDLAVLRIETPGWR